MNMKWEFSKRIIDDFSFSKMESFEKRRRFELWEIIGENVHKIMRKRFSYIRVD